MSMELLGNEFLEEFYPTAEANRARKTHLEGNHRFFSVDGDGGRVSALDLHARRPQRAPSARRRICNSWTASAATWIFPATKKSARIRGTGSSTFFIHPFYYVEYGIAQLGALQVWANSKRDKAKALNDYKKSLALGGSRPLPELFAAAGCKFEFSVKMIQPASEIAAGRIGETLKEIFSLFWCWLNWTNYSLNQHQHRLRI